VPQSGSVLRWSALLGAGALAVHELQYRVSFGAGAEAALIAHGHAYLSWALALVSVLTALAAVRLLAEVGGARRGRPASARRAPASLWHRWIWSSAALATIYLLQESLEGLLAAGHPGVVHAVGSHHGWPAGRGRARGADRLPHARGRRDRRARTPCLGCSAPSRRPDDLAPSRPPSRPSPRRSRQSPCGPCPAAVLPVS
jgi:hypothetical protein